MVKGALGYSAHRRGEYIVRSAMESWSRNTISDGPRVTQMSALKSAGR